MIHRHSPPHPLFEPPKPITAERPHSDRLSLQSHRVLDMLASGPLTQRDVFNLGIQRLAARIKDLRDAGHDIRAEPIADGAGTVRYYLVQKEVTCR